MTLFFCLLVYLHDHNTPFIPLQITTITCRNPGCLLLSTRPIGVNASKKTKNNLQIFYERHHLHHPVTLLLQDLQWGSKCCRSDKKQLLILIIKCIFCLLEAAGTESLWSWYYWTDNNHDWVVIHYKCLDWKPPLLSKPKYTWQGKEGKNLAGEEMKDISVLIMVRKTCLHFYSMNTESFRDAIVVGQVVSRGSLSILLAPPITGPETGWRGRGMFTWMMVSQRGCRIR